MTGRIFCKVLLVVVAIFGLLVLSGVLSAQGRSEDAFGRVREVQERNTDRLMAMNGVEGTAIGLDQSGQLAVKVFTARPGVAGIAKKLDGVPVHVVVTGKIYALPKGSKPDKPGKPPKDEPPADELDPTSRWPQPVPIGVSTGHPDITAGTIACRVTDGDNVYALSNNHVYANSNEASLGDAVIQPGTSDGGLSPADDIGTLFAFEPIVFSRRARNEIDAAIALTDIEMVGTATPAGGYGTPNSTIVGAFIGQQVQKFGRTTGLTTGEVTGVNATVNVGYGSGKTAKFVKQIIIEPSGFSAGGDSGSLIVTDDDNLNPVGLLFAGSSTITVANRIDLVLDRFSVTVDGQEPAPPTTGSISGKVTDAYTKDSIEGATVTADGYTTTTATDGTYTLVDLPVGSYIVTASATGYTDESKTAEVLDDQTTVVHFELTPAPVPADDVTITKAEYRVRSSDLKVEATSTQGGTAVLTVEGYGTMTYDTRKNKYTFRQKGAPDPQDWVTVTSSLGGTETAPVKYR